jgi:DNA invertase Pin-like site-specific DNA recombinase
MNLKVNGLDHGRSLLNEEEVRTIYYSQTSYRKLARQINISTTTIFNIKHKIAWKHLTDEFDRCRSSRH